METENKEIQKFLEKAGLWELTHRIQDLMDAYDFCDISFKLFGPLDHGVVVLSIGVKNTIISVQRIDAEEASTMRKAALASATEEELMDLLTFLRKAIIVSYNDELKGWIESCITAAKLALKEKL